MIARLAALSLSPPATIGAGAAASVAFAVSNVRGGGGAAAAADAAFDLTRARIRLEGLSAYGVTCALLMNAALRVFGGTPKTIQELPEKEGPERRRVRAENIATVVFSASTCLSILCGLYTTIVFSMLALYSKTALGMGIDANYLKFFEMTASIRKSGFDMYVLSLLSFNGSFAMSLFLHYKGPMRMGLSGLAFVFTLFSWVNISRIMGLASVLLFQS
jgi:hypothetical protein